MNSLKLNGFKHSVVVSMAFLGLLFAGAAMADSPVKIDKPDRHSVEVKGRVNLYRVQVEGMDFGQGKNKAHAEVLVTLDSQPGMIYTLSLHSANNADVVNIANQEIAETLRTAYVNKIPVTLYHQLPIQQSNNLKILMVQMDNCPDTGHC